MLKVVNMGNQEPLGKKNLTNQMFYTYSIKHDRYDELKVSQGGSD